MKKILIIFILLLLVGIQVKAQENDYAKVISLLKSLDKALPEPGPNDWLAHNDEPGQTFAEYKASNCYVENDVVYIQPIGRFTKAQRKIISRTSYFLKLFYNMNVKIKADLSESLIPSDAVRKNPMQGMKQFLAPYLIDELLVAHKPKDAAAYLGLTAVDLWPGEGWNFVFGLATPDNQLGVWSIYRYGNPDKDDDAFELALLRTLKVAAHELGHMFGIMHCTNALCLMNGANHLKETDESPLTLCSECAPKLLLLSNVDISERYRKLADWTSQYGLIEESNDYSKRLNLFK